MEATWLMTIARVGMALSFLICICIDIKTRVQVFDLMQQKKVPWPWFCFVGAITLKLLTALALLFNFYTTAAAIILALYVFVANVVFNNFWAVPGENREFTFIMFILHIAIGFGLLAIAG